MTDMTAKANGYIQIQPRDRYIWFAWVNSESRPASDASGYITEFKRVSYFEARTASALNGFPLWIVLVLGVIGLLVCCTCAYFFCFKPVDPSTLVDDHKFHDHKKNPHKHKEEQKEGATEFTDINKQADAEANKMEA